MLKVKHLFLSYVLLHTPTFAIQPVCQMILTISTDSRYGKRLPASKPMSSIKIVKLPGNIRSNNGIIASAPDIPLINPTKKHPNSKAVQKGDPKPPVTAWTAVNNAATYNYTYQHNGASQTYQPGVTQLNLVTAMNGACASYHEFTIVATKIWRSLLRRST